MATDVKYIANSSLGSRPLYAVKPSEVQTWVNNCSKGTGVREALAPGTVRNRYITLKAVFAAAVDDQLIGRSPCLKRIALPKADKVEFQPLSLDQVDLLADAMPNRYRAMVLTQAGLGLRVGELLALQRRDVDFLRHTVRIERQQSDEGANLFEPTKNGVKRSVPLPQAVADALAAHLAAEPQEELHGLIFRSRFGNGLRQDYYTLRVLRPAVVKVGLTGTTSHDLRHHFVSLALSQGVPIPKVAAWIGDTVKTVDEFYAHDMPDTEAQNLAAMNDAWARARQARSGRAGAAAR